MYELGVIPNKHKGSDMEGFVYLYVFMLAAFTGYEVISRVPVILHTPLMSGSNFVHGVVLVGGMVALGQADPDSPLQLAIGFIAVLLGAPSKCKPVVGSSKMKSVLLAEACERCAASFTRCASPPLSVVADCPRRR